MGDGWHQLRHGRSRIRVNQHLTSTSHLLEQLLRLQGYETTEWNRPGA